jgi:phosphatidylserine/phosphatidylglycerophosphate/cardiolipin synthase-like enzyme
VKIHQRLLFEIAGAVVLVGASALAISWHFHRKFQVFYSLDARHNDQVVASVIDHAQKYVYFAVYTFTMSTIADALIRAKRRGVVVWGITDADQATVPQEALILSRLNEAGITVETQKHQDGIMHIKAVVTDSEYASGSYNWTASATTANDEVLEVSSDSALRQKYLAIIKKVLITNE